MSADPVALRIDARPRPLGNLEVARLLPARARRMVGPFAFVDHFGPVGLAPGAGMDVLPHPHIGLSTVTWLIEGEVLHRDSVGSTQRVRPGGVSWMTAGRGIVHSERSPPDTRPAGPRLHGLQLWVALPAAHEDVAPSYSHHPADALPAIDGPGLRGSVLAGTAYGLASPVPVHSPLMFVEATLGPGARLEVPVEHEERSVYVLDGEAACGAHRIGARTMVVLDPGVHAVVEATATARLVLMGGTPIGPRYVWWNFVATAPERIEQAARDWRAGRFPRIPGDEAESVALDEEPPWTRTPR